MQLKTFATSIILALSSPAYADGEPSEESYDKMSGFYGSVGTVNFDAESSRQYLIGDSATYWKLGWEQHKNE